MSEADAPEAGLQVLAHPEFKKNPIAAVASHLDATLPPIRAPEEPAAKKKTPNVPGSRRRKSQKIRRAAEAPMEA